MVYNNLLSFLFILLGVEKSNPSYGSFFPKINYLSLITDFIPFEESFGFGDGNDGTYLKMMIKY